MNIESSKIEEYEEFASSNSFYLIVKNMAEYVTPDLVCRSLFINNLPLDITKEQILKILQVFNIVNIYFIFRRMTLT